MAEAPAEERTLPQKGRVQAVRQQWSVHEDGALAYNAQQEEFAEHYGMNRYHRRTVRGDIPIAKIIQSEEELKQQEDRMRELEALKIQAEEDERVAKMMTERLKRDVASEEALREMDDEEIARQLQEKEKKKYERHLEKKREKMLKEERKILEAALARESEEARLAVNSDSGSARIGDSMESLDAQGVNIKRVTPAGRIEDEGDFSDFYKLPEELDELSRMEIQASQDEELARLLQEQEHKRTKAEVDLDKLRQIEFQDEKLARVMQEQERIRLKKAKQRHKEKKEAQKMKQAEQLPLGASANTMNQLQLQHSPDSGRGPDPPSGAAPAGGQPPHTRYRRNSYTQAFDSPPSPPKSQPPPRRPAVNAGANPSQAPTLAAQAPAKPSHHQAPSQPSPAGHRTGYIDSPGGGMSTLESARRIAAGDPERIRALQDSNSSSQGRTARPGFVQEGMVTQRDGTSTIDIIRAHSQHKPARGGPTHNNNHYTNDPVTYSEPYITSHRGDEGVGKPGLRDTEATEVMKWMGPGDGVDIDPRRGPPPQYPHHLKQTRQDAQQVHNTYYSSDEEENPHPAINGSAGFNIAAAIDPTYQRRHPELSIPSNDVAHSAPHIPFSRSLPQADGELEWDPGLRGSLRKTKAPLHLHQDSSASGSLHQGGSGGEAMPPWQPVQGQRRNDGTKSRSGNSGSGGKSRAGDEGTKKDKGSCKQQ
ncbi:serine/arginine repetitive matrix protein 1-like isoform x3 [Plakobranchus ocellatus]|uniref:Serine/arginine repetitive matrix protein 1-like isoform x3 n=1 Tax=Plakobranchus ocellatus TaxID=259542 RepID=A0AAV3ZM98_9GAST|nr:serine/arginine repetitive matrix protein 1-like isoform x3 [Plakobranchus ocellatus]